MRSVDTAPDAFLELSDSGMHVYNFSDPSACVYTEEATISTTYPNEPDDNGNIAYTTVTETKKVFFFYDWRKIRDSMPSAHFFEWFSVNGRVSGYVDTEKGGFFESGFGWFVMTLLSIVISGPTGLFWSFGIKAGIGIYQDHVRDDPSYNTSSSEIISWSYGTSDEYLSDNLLSVPPLPIY